MESSVAPMLVAGVTYGSITPLYVAAKGSMLVLTNTNLVNGLVCLIAAYYVFNIQYPNKGKNIFAFLEAVLLRNVAEARERVSVDKFMQQLDIMSC